MTVNLRGVSELLHFTTSHGVLGSLYSKYLKSRQRLEGDKLVEYLFKPNSTFRKDAAYLDYVNLSLESINQPFYQICADKWHKHEDIFWAIMSFDPNIMDHDGVTFATTNNMYTSVAHGVGYAGYGSLFADRVHRYQNNFAVRASDMPNSYPTCEQAEVLYPGEISTTYLRHIYTKTEQDKSEVIGFLKATYHDPVDVTVQPDRFLRRT